MDESVDSGIKYNAEVIDAVIFDAACELIKLFEGFEPVAYKDIAGHWTVGYGQRDGTIQGMTVTKETAKAWLKQRVMRDYRDLHNWANGIHGIYLAPQHYAALLSWCYNFSFGLFEKSTLAKVIIAWRSSGATLQDVQQQWMRWVHARIDGTMTVVKGLERRRKVEFALFTTAIEQAFFESAKERLAQKETPAPAPASTSATPEINQREKPRSPQFGTTYDAFVHSLAPDPETDRIKTTIAMPEVINKIHAILGMLTELAELADPLKKYLFYDKQMTLENEVEELGDIKWYWTLYGNTINKTDSEITQSNFDKLMKRYPGGKFTQAAALNRADKHNESPNRPTTHI